MYSTSLLRHIFFVAPILAVSAQDSPSYQPCPLLRFYYPAPRINTSSELVQDMSTEFTGMFDDLVATGFSEDFGSVTPNTTSFSVILFSGSDDFEEDPIFFEYHHKADDEVDANNDLNFETVFPLGSLTQLFTVYTWLIRMGNGHWQTSITDFLPELKSSNLTADSLTVNWEEVTVGALAGQMSGIARDSFACNIGEPCSRQEFISKFAHSIPMPNPTLLRSCPMRLFQLLAFALERSCPAKDFASIISEDMATPLGLIGTSLLSPDTESTVFSRDISSNLTGEPAALGLLSTPRDLARIGHAMLSSRLISPATTRDWLQPVADTSNLRNGVGRPWEIYHAGQQANSSILDVYTKTGTVGSYSSYFGLSPDLNAGFAILAHDTTGKAPDLNVYADYASLAVALLEKLAAEQTAAAFSGNFTDAAVTGNELTLDATDGGPGITITSMIVNGVDLRNLTAAVANIALQDLDLRMYPSNVVSESEQVFVVVFQDRAAPVDQGTPTCITWQEVGILGASMVDRLVVSLNPEDGSALSVKVPGAVAVVETQSLPEPLDLDTSLKQ